MGPDLTPPSSRLAVPATRDLCGGQDNRSSRVTTVPVGSLLDLCCASCPSPEDEACSHAADNTLEVEAAGACSFPPCPRPAAVTLRVQVPGGESVLSVCQPHADWLRTYADEDDAIQLDIPGTG